MVRKTLDSRLHTLIKNGVQNKHRSFFVLIGDKGKDQVVNLHWLLSQAQVTSRPSVLWCYKKELGFTSHRKKREAKLKKEIKRGIREANDEDPFELFVSVTDIRYTYYKESHKILGNTYGMCVLQDFEALTPNLLARTVETVEGGGIVVLLLRTMKSLKQLYTMTMDVHSRYRTEAHNDVVARFNERFILSLSSSENCLVVDDELNILPISLGRNVRPLPPKASDEESESNVELKELKISLADTQPVGALVACAKTLDQAKALLTFVEAISEKSLRSTVALTAARGRGKSASLGVAIAAAVAHGYANIFVTSPSPENLKTLFEFIFKGFDALKYEEHLDYDIVQSTNPDFNKAVVRVNIFRQHRQTIQYIQPQDAHTLGQAELVVIDEAAAIPLPLVKALLGPYLVFMASTVNGYEGTGRSLSLKLIQQLREQSRGFVGRGPTRMETADGVVVKRDGKARKSEEGGVGGVDPSLANAGSSAGGRVLREIKLEEPIRYDAGDPVEKWLNKLLCLDCTTTSANSLQQSGCPHPSGCELYHVNRDTLFSYHPVSEAFLQRMMSLYVASHYKNTPNDLQLLSDAPAHHLFVLLPPVKAGDTTLPEPLCVVQVALEGEISKQTVMKSLARGIKSAGDLIPWLISQQFQDDDFASLSGARVVRIATHPDYMKMGYGARALQLLGQYYEGKFTSLDENDPKKTLGEEETDFVRVEDHEIETATLRTDEIRVRDPRKMPPLLLRLSERAPQRLHWLGVSYGLTAQLHRFWKRSGFSPVYLRQTANDLTGENSCIMLKALSTDGLSTQASDGWLDLFAKDFGKRFLDLLSFQFKTYPSVLALSILEAASGLSKDNKTMTKEDIDRDFSAYDLKRLESYARNMLDYHVIIDLLPTLAKHFFTHRLGPKVSLSGVQSAILLAIGLQRKSIDDLEKELSLPSSQVLALFSKIIRKISTSFQETLEGVARAEMTETSAANAVAVTKKGKGSKNPEKRDLTDQEAWDPVTETLDEDLNDASAEAMRAVREKQKEMINSLDLSKYAIGGKDEDWDAVAAKAVGNKGSKVVSIPNADSSKKRKQGAVEEIAAEHAKSKAKESARHKTGKKTKRT